MSKEKKYLTTLDAKNNTQLLNDIRLMLLESRVGDAYKSEIKAPY